MPRVLVYFDSPVVRKATEFAASRIDPGIEVVVASDHAEASELLAEQAWDLAIVGLEPEDFALVEACADRGIPSLAGVCIDTPGHEALARKHGATRSWQWPMRVHLATELIREQLGLAQDG